MFSPIINDVCVFIVRKNMEKMMLVLLMLVLLGVFIHSSQAVRCYQCSMCTILTSHTRKRTCLGEVCYKVRYRLRGAFTIRV